MKHAFTIDLDGLTTLDELIEYFELQGLPRDALVLIRQEPVTATVHRGSDAGPTGIVRGTPQSDWVNVDSGSWSPAMNYVEHNGGCRHYFTLGGTVDLKNCPGLKRTGADE